MKNNYGFQMACTIIIGSELGVSVLSTYLQDAKDWVEKGITPYASHLLFFGREAGRVSDEIDKMLKTGEAQRMYENMVKKYCSAE